jgi:hypothetical protein
MLTMTWCRAVRGLALATCLLAALHGGPTAEESTTLSLDIPTAIGDLKFNEVRKATEETRSTQLVYKAPGLTLTVYIYGARPGTPDGIESEQLNAEFAQAKGAIQDPRAWKHAKLEHEGTAQFGAPPHLFAAREAAFGVKSEDGSATSYLYLMAEQGVFFKVRYTVHKNQRETGEAQLPAIRQRVGELIAKVIEKKGGPDQPVEAQRPASTPEDRAQAVRFAGELEANPMADDAPDKRSWLIGWYTRVPDITLTVCSLLGPFPKKDHPFFPQVLTQSMFSGGAFMIENPDRAKDQVAVQTAGMLGALKVYEVFAKAMPEERLPFLDGLLERRDQGTLAAYMPDAVAEGCK